MNGRTVRGRQYPWGAVEGKIYPLSFSWKAKADIQKS